MRRMMAAPAMALVAGCFYGPDTQGRYDPRLYDAGGKFVTAAAPAPAPAPEAPPAARSGAPSPSAAKPRKP